MFACLSDNRLESEGIVVSGGIPEVRDRFTDLQTADGLDDYLVAVFIDLFICSEVICFLTVVKTD